jgi:alpha,alpha-trehalase
VRVLLTRGPRLADCCFSNLCGFDLQRNCRRRYPTPSCPRGRDSYFIVKGLLQSDMHSTARKMLLNMVHLIQEHGFVPNGARVYYRTRSQPPVAALVAEDLLDAGAITAADLPEIVRALDTEYAFFAAHRALTVAGHSLSRYYSDNATELHRRPRPESYFEDQSLAAASFASNASRALLWRQLRAGAESGWDYSSRWIRGRR